MANGATWMTLVLPVLAAVAGCGSPTPEKNPKMERAFALQREYIRLFECASVMRRVEQAHGNLARGYAGAPTTPEERREAREQQRVRADAKARVERAADAVRRDALAAGAGIVRGGDVSVMMDLELDIMAAETRLQQSVPFELGAQRTIAALADRVAACDRLLPPA